MPALLYYLDAEAAAPAGDPGMDCGTAIVYSCDASCGGDDYAQEFVFVQRDCLNAA